MTHGKVALGWIGYLGVHIGFSSSHGLLSDRDLRQAFTMGKEKGGSSASPDAEHLIKLIGFSTRLTFDNMNQRKKEN